MKTLEKRVIIIIVIIVCICVGLWRFANTDNRGLVDNMIGTFCDDNFPDHEYVVIDQENNYLQYIQNEKIAEGRAAAEGEIIYIENDSRRICAIYKDFKIYVFDEEQDEIKIFEKISNVPTYINIEP